MPPTSEQQEPHARPVELSVVCPMFNEADGIAPFLAELRATLDAAGLDYEVIVVDDASTDASVRTVASLRWDRCRVLALARNGGHQIALEAGLAVARGAWVATMDADGQHPPQTVVDMLDRARAEQLDVVYAVQAVRRTDSWSKRTLALAYYRTVRLLTGVAVADSQADFRLMSAAVLDDVRRVPGDKVLRLLLPAVGYRSDVVEYDVRDRLAGEGRFGLRRQLRLAANSILNFSARPLRFVAAAGLLLSAGAFLWLVYVLLTYLSTRTVDGWSSTMAAVLVVGGITLVSVSIVGEYVARIHDLLLRHPRYSARWVEPDASAVERRVPVDDVGAEPEQP